MATGDEKYFILAANLLKSYQLFAYERYPFAIITDKRNKYTELFDDVVVIENAEGSYMDKINLVVNCPYEENIFIDADCLAYGNLNLYWELFEGADDFSCFGNCLPLDSEKGWFKKNDVCEYKNNYFITHLHGVIYFIRNGSTCKRFLVTCQNIIQNYDRYHFKAFDKPADEPVFALAMALHNLRPIERKPNLYIFLPMAIKINMDIAKGFLSYETEKDGIVEKGMLLHWANVNTDRAAYKIEAYKLSKLTSNEKINSYKLNRKKIVWGIEDFIKDSRKEFINYKSKFKSMIYNMINN